MLYRKTERRTFREKGQNAKKVRRRATRRTRTRNSTFIRFVLFLRASTMNKKKNISNGKSDAPLFKNTQCCTTWYLKTRRHVPVICARVYFSSATHGAVRDYFGRFQYRWKTARPEPIYLYGAVEYILFVRSPDRRPRDLFFCIHAGARCAL